MLLLRLIVLDAQMTLLKFILKHITNGKLASALSKPARVVVCLIWVKEIIRAACSS